MTSRRGESMLRRYGYAHTKLVLLSIAETKNNARELVAPTIWAVSDLVAAHPQWAERASDWLAAFDKVDLGQLCAFAKRNKAVKQRAGLCSLLFGFLSAQMERPEKLAEPVTEARGRQAAVMAA
ncbi:MAG: hypothetical protein KGK16_01535 [Bradyrhizobium sp.]|nr:hypothetical protein [Bradyrhizobium sp.]